ncbi:hypothetical protein FQR65_LT13392 [Abscondita terminalis]|nr:hypothetical protein FQR65_LT13392 [Abscondita terminalis]
MGGCRCSYKNCVRATNNSEREFHFFHYPVKDPERCLKWITNARKPNFFKLPEDQLRNKVICQNHFEPNYFTNANRKRLIRSAVPTLDVDCSDPEVEDMCNVQVLQSDADASVFTVDTNLMSMNEISKVRSFLIENGDIIPADLNQEPKSEQESHIVRTIEKVPQSDVVINNCIDYKIEDVIENEISVKNEPECVKTVEQLCDNDVIIEKTIKKGVSNSSKPVVTVVKSGKMAKSLSKAVEEHTKEIARLKRLLNLRIQKVKQKRQNQKLQVLGKLRGLLPSTLLALVNIHVLRKQDNFTKQEKHLLTTLFNASPSTYEVLINDCKWKLPNATIVQNLTSIGNGIR